MHKCQENAEKLYMELRLVVGSRIGKQTKQSQIPSQNDNYLFFLSFGFHVQLTNERVSSMIPGLIQNPYSCERADFHLTFCNAIATVNCIPNGDQRLSHYELLGPLPPPACHDYHPLHAKLFMIPISFAAPVLLESATLSDPVLVSRSTTFSMSCARSCFDSLDSSKNPRGTFCFGLSWPSMSSLLFFVLLLIVLLPTVIVVDVEN